MSAAVKKPEAKFTDAFVDYKGRLRVSFRIGARRYWTVLCESPELIIMPTYVDDDSRARRPLAGIRKVKTDQNLAVRVSKSMLSFNRPSMKKRS